MDRFPDHDRRQRRRHREHRHDRHRPSHRHQHDRTGGGRAALHHRRWCRIDVSRSPRRPSPTSSWPSSSAAGSSTPASTGARSRSSVGSEIELAPNRKPYFDDETLEGRRLERVQLIGVLLLVVVVIGLPLYWIFEPARMRGAAAAEEETFIERGAALFAPTGDNLQAFNCAGCHGGMNATGGEAPYTVASATTGEVRAVDWKAPALNTVFYRFSREEVRYIITYGRPGSPMSAWGLDGGGPTELHSRSTPCSITSSRSRSRVRTASPRRRVIRCARADTCRPRSRPTSSKRPASPSRTARTPATARRCSTSI